MVAVNSIITKSGRGYDVGSERHRIYTQRHFKLTLKKFLQNGGVRVKTHNDHMAIEAGKPLTVKQKRWIRSALKGHDYFSVIVSIGGKYASKERFRPIRSI